MPSGPWKVYGAAVEKVARNTLDLDDATANRYRCILLTSAYTPAQGTHATYADVSAFEATGTGYTAGGAALTSVTVTRASNTITFDCADPSWPSSTITAKYAVLVRDADANGALASTDDLLCYCDVDTASTSTSLSSNNSTFLVQMHASGVFALTAS